MKKTWKKTLSVFLTLSMVTALAPATAWAEVEGGDTTPIEAAAGQEQEVENIGDNSADLTTGETETPTGDTQQAPVVENNEKTPEETPAEGAGTADDADADVGFEDAEDADETDTDLEEEESEEDVDVANQITTFSTEEEIAQAETENVAEVNGTKYATLVEAVAEAADGATITLLTDASGNGIGTYKNHGEGQIAAKSFTIDFGGHTYTIANAPVGSEGYETQAFHLEWSGNGEENHIVTLKNGTITSAADSGVAMLIQNYCDLTLEDMTLDGENLGDGAYVLSNNCGNVTIEDSTINTKDDSQVAFDVYGGFGSYSDVTVTVTGDSEINGDIEVARADTTNENTNTLIIEDGTINGEIKAEETLPENSEITISGGTFSESALSTVKPEYLAEGKTRVLQEDGSFVVKVAPEGAVPVEGEEKLYYENAAAQEANNAAKIGDTYYKTLAEAVSDAEKDGVTEITLINNIVLESPVEITGKNITIDLDGHSITSAETWLSTRSGLIYSQDSAIVTIKDTAGDGEIYANSDKDDKGARAAVIVWPGKENATATLIVNGGTLKGRSFGISGNGNQHGTVITINDGEIIGENGTGIYHPQDGTMTINGGEITGKNAAVEIRSGTVNIKGGTFTATATEYSEEKNSNGTTVSGAALAISQHTTEKAINVTIEDGTFEGAYALSETTVQNGDQTHDVKITSISDGTFDGNVKAEVSKNFISGGHFTSDPTQYKAEGYYVVESDKPGYFFTVTNTKPDEAQIIVTETVAGSVKEEAVISEEDKTAIENVIDQSEASGVAEALKDEAKQNILEATKVEVEANTDVVEIEISVNVEATRANLSGEEATENFVAYDVTPVATVKVNGEEKGETPVSNSYLKGDRITVKLPIPEGLTVTEVKHTCADGSVEYFYEKGGNKNFTIENEKLVVVEITKFSEILLSGTVTAVAKADGVGYATLQEAVDAVEDGGTLEILADGLDAKVKGNKTFTVEAEEGISFELTASSGYRLYDNEDGTYTVKKKSKPSSGGSSSGGSSSSEEKTYAVSKADVDNGEVKIDPAKAEKGDKVTITVTPDQGYEIDKVKVTDADGNKIDIKDKGNGEYTFTMPDSKVEVKATFTKAEETPVAPEEVKTIVLTINQLAMSIFGETKINDVAPIIRNDRTMLPIRVVAEALGATVAWDDAQNKVTITKDELVIEIFIGSPFAKVNGTPVQLDSPAFIENSRTYLPIRFVAENLGADVAWDQATQQVTITPNK